MDSVNVPIPGRVAALAADVAADLTAADAGLGERAGGVDPGGAITGASGSPKLRVRDDRTLVAKRLPAGDAHRIEARARAALAGTPAFEARIDRVDWFETAAAGPSPVVYLAVDSPGLARLHERLCGAFDPVDGIEGGAYTPHVTVARGGDPAAARRVLGPVDPVEWTVTELWLWDADRGLAAGRVSLPA